MPVTKISPKHTHANEQIIRIFSPPSLGQSRLTPNVADIVETETSLCDRYYVYEKEVV
jgi:hypothetical protein